MVSAGGRLGALSRGRPGALGDLFPSSVVHGMLAAIGVIIFSKQAHVMLGVSPEPGEPLHLLAQLPQSIAGANPEILLIGALSLAVLFGMPKLKWSWAKKVPPPLVVVVLSVALGSYFDLGHERPYQFQAHDYVVGRSFLGALPGRIDLFMAAAQ